MTPRTKALVAVVSVMAVLALPAAASAAPGPAAGLRVLEDNVAYPTLVWYPGSDSTGAKIYRDGQLVDTIQTPFMASSAWWQDKNPPADGTHTYDVIMTGFGGSVSSSGATQVNLKDGSFQAPRVTNGAWITYYSPSYLGGWEVLSNSVDLNDRSSWQQTPNGGQTVDLTGEYAGGIQQTISTPGGSSVPMRVTFQMAGNYQCMDTTKSVTVTAGSSQQTFTHKWFSGWNVATRAGWQKKTFDFTPTGNTTLIKFQSNNAMWCGPLIGDIRVIRQDGQTGVTVNVDSGVHRDGQLDAPYMWVPGIAPKTPETGPYNKQYIGGPGIFNENPNGETWLKGVTFGYSDEGSVKFKIHIVGQPANKLYSCPATPEYECGSDATYYRSWTCEWKVRKFLPTSGQIEVSIVGNSIESDPVTLDVDNTPPAPPSVSGIDKSRSDLTQGQFTISGGSDSESGTVGYLCRLSMGVNLGESAAFWQSCSANSPQFDGALVTGITSQYFSFFKGPNRIQVVAVDRLGNRSAPTEYRWGGNPQNASLPQVRRSGTTLTISRGVWTYPSFSTAHADKSLFDSTSAYTARLEKRADSSSTATSQALSGTLTDRNQSATWSHALGSGHGQVRACITAKNNADYGTATPEACSSWLTY